MKRVCFLTFAALLGILAVGCSSPTPEEKEAAKYPKAKPLTPEEQERVKALTGLPPEAHGSK